MERKSGIRMARGKGPESSSARLYVSTVNFEPDYTRDNLYGIQREDSEIQRMNIKVIEKLLAEFDLDRTEQKHLSKYIVEFAFDPNDYGSDSSIVTTRIRQRLQRLMGTDIIRLNDKKYFDKLSKKIREEYQADLLEKEHVLAEAEEERVRRLMLEGIIPIPDDIGTEHGHHRYTKRKKRKPGEYKHSYPNRKKTHDSSVDSPRKLLVRADRSPTPTRKKDEDVVTQVQIMGSSHKKASARKSSVTKQDKTLRRSKSSTLSPARSQQKPGGSYSAISVEIPEISEVKHTDSSSLSLKDEKKGKHTKVRAPLVEELRKQETVSGLYNVASRLVN